MPVQVQMLARPFLNSYLQRSEEMTDEKIDMFLGLILDEVNYIKDGERNGNNQK